MAAGCLIAKPVTWDRVIGAAKSGSVLAPLFAARSDYAGLPPSLLLHHLTILFHQPVLDPTYLLLTPEYSSAPSHSYETVYPKLQQRNPLAPTISYQPSKHKEIPANMRSKFKDEHPFEKRKAEAERIRQKYSDRIPVSAHIAPHPILTLPLPSTKRIIDPHPTSPQP